MYYRTSKLTFVTNTPIRTALRDISEFTIVHTASAETLRVYAAHLNASSGSTNEAGRTAEVNSLRKVTNSLPDGKYFAVCGDFNLYSSNEQAYQKLPQDNPIEHLISCERQAKAFQWRCFWIIGGVFLILLVVNLTMDWITNIGSALGNPLTGVLSYLPLAQTHSKITKRTIG